jgi:hypothetical protein
MLKYVVRVVIIVLWRVNTTAALSKQHKSEAGPPDGPKIL